MELLPEPFRTSRIRLPFACHIIRIASISRLAQGYELWSDIRLLEREFGQRYLTHESDDARWSDYERDKGIVPVYK